MAAADHPPGDPEEPSDPGASQRQPSFSDIIEQQDEDDERFVTSRRQSREAFSVYIDARSGGSYFAGKTHVGHDVIGRDQQTAGTTSRQDRNAMAGQVAEEHLRKVRKVYQPTSEYGEARRVLDSKHVVVLHGRQHSGKWTTALHLLAASDSSGIAEINPDIDLDDLVGFGFERGRRYAVDAFRPESAEQLTGFVLNRLSDVLEERSSYLVLTVDTRVSLSKDAVAGYLITWSELPDRATLLERHLAWYLSAAKADTDGRGLADSAAVRELLETHLLPGEIDRLAELLAQAARGEISHEEALQRFDVRAQQEVGEWFAKHDDLADCAFMIAAAIFNGASYQAVASAAARLQELLEPLDPAPPDQERRDRRPVFGTTRTQRLKDVGARLESGYRVAEFGLGAVELLQLDNPTVQPAVLRHVWHEHHAVRAPLLTWLGELGRHRSAEVRLRAAAAVGKLAEYDFGHVRAEVLLPWATDENERARDSAADALGVTAWGSEVAPQVFGLLHHWSTLEGNSRLRWTAAAAYGGYAGLRFPEVALKDLHRILGSGDLRLVGVCSRSVLSLFEVGNVVPELYGLVLDAVDTWSTEDGSSVLALSSLIIALRLARDAKVEPVRHPGQAWPTLLWLVDAGGARREQVVALLRRALDAKETRPAALDVMHAWVLRADAIPDVASPLESLVLELARGEHGRERTRLNEYLARWARDPDRPSQVAERMRSLLS